MKFISAGFVLLAGRGVEATWAPEFSVQELNKVEGALRTIAEKSNLAPTQLASSKHVIADVDMVVAELTAKNSTLSQDVKAQKLAGAVKELMGLKSEWQAMAAAASKPKQTPDKLKEMQKELQEKKAELAKDNQMLKLVNLEKELDEKKLQLQHLIAQKQKKTVTDKAEAEDQKMRSQMIAKLVKMASSLKTKAEDKSKSTELQTILAGLTQRSDTVKASLAKLEADEKTSVSELDKVLKQQKEKLKNDALVKAEMTLGSLRKDEERKFRKARAVKQAEMKEIDEAIKDINSGDVAALQKTMKKMNHELKASNARAGNFLH